MAFPLLRTKFFIPPSRPELVPRPRLFAQLDEGLQLGRKLSLVSAPAGYGKTTLVVDWAYKLIQESCSLAWLSLDDGDNDPARFWIYVISALTNIAHLKEIDFGQSTITALQSANPPPYQSFLTDLINEVIDISEKIVLVLDDMHLITNPDIHAGLSFILEQVHSASIQFHLVVATRQDPPWPMARLRSADDITELRSIDLRFTEHETRAFITNVMGIELSTEDSAVLGELTEGWIAGLQMAALSMQDREDISGFLSIFSGSHRFVLDYLVEEVLERQTPAVQDFLLKTSILDRLSASLCAALCYDKIDESLHPGSGAHAAHKQGTHLDTSQRHLDYLEQANLFLVPLDDRREWYRYHKLFVDLLNSHLRIRQPHLILQLHSRASTWYAAHGWIAEAVHHALAGNEIEQAARLIETNAFAMLDLDRIGTLQSWLIKIPGEIRNTRPWLCIAHAWVQVYAGNIDDANQILVQTESILDVLKGEQQERAIGHINTIRAYAAWMQADGENAVLFARQSLEKLPADELMVRGLAATMLAGGLLQCGDVNSSIPVGQDAIRWSRASKNLHGYMLAAGAHAYHLIIKGHLCKAETICQEALDASETQVGQPGGQSPAIAQVYAMLSDVKLARNETGQALTLAKEGLRVSRRWAQADTQTLNSVYLCNALISAGDLKQAAEVLEESTQAGAQVSDWFAAIIAYQEAELFLADGNIGAAVHWAEQREMGYRDDIPQSSQSAYQIFAKVLIALGELSQASHLLDNMIADVEESGAMGVLVKLLSLKAVVIAGLGEQSQASLFLDRALLLAEPERIMRPFLAAGEMMIPLLRNAIKRGTVPAFVGELLYAMDAGRTESPSLRKVYESSRMAAPREFRDLLVDPLTKREIDVLRLLNTSLSIPEIADEIYVAPSTVRSHVRNIYSKLGVHGRFEAVQLAKELELL